MLAVLAAGTAAGAGVGVASSVAATPPPAITSCGPTSPHGMVEGQEMSVGNGQPYACLTSPSGRYALVLQGDGNLVLVTGLTQATPNVLWDTGTSGHPGAHLTMQPDGNLVLYSTGTSATGTAYWASGTNGALNAGLVLQDDGNLVVYANNLPPATALPYPAWNTGTAGLLGDRLQGGQSLQPGQRLVSSTKQYLLTMQTNGMLVLAEASPTAALCPMWTMPGVTSGQITESYPPTFAYPGTPIFTFDTPTGTRHPGAYLSLQGDGNLVLYKPGVTSGALWSTGTQDTNPKGARLTLQTDGNLVVYGATGAPVWATGTNDDRGLALCTGDRLGQGQYISGFPAVGTTGNASNTAGSKPPDGQELAVQSTCNVVMEATGNVVWTTGTSTLNAGDRHSPLASNVDYGGCYLVMQNDGNLVEYGPYATSTHQVMWQSGSNQNFTSPIANQLAGPYFLNLYYSGNIASVYNDSGTQLWTEDPAGLESAQSARVLGDVPGWIADILGIVAGIL